MEMETVMTFFQRIVGKIKLRFFPTANLVAAYKLIERVELKNEELLKSIDNIDAKALIYAELVRRGDESLV
jgi:hypothetical protein